MTAPLLGLETTLSVTGAPEVIGAIQNVEGAAQEAAVGGLSQLDRMMERLTERFAIYEVLSEVVRGIKDFAAAGMEANRATQLLDFQLRSTGGNFEELSAAAERAVAGVSKLGMSTGTELTQALQRLVLITGNATFATTHLGEAQDIAAATGMDVVTAATNLGRAYNGVWIQLERLGLVTKEQVESGGAMDALEAKVEGSTRAALEGAGAWTKLETQMKNAWEEGANAAAKNTAVIATSLSALLRMGLGQAPLEYGPMATTATTLPGVFATPPAVRIGGPTVTGRAGTPQEAQLAYLRYQEEQLKNDLKTTTDLGDRLKILNEIAKVEHEITELIKKQSELSPAQQAAADAILKGIPHEAGREKDLGTGPSIGQLDPRLAPGANEVNIGAGVGGTNDAAITNTGNQMVAQIQALQSRVQSVSQSVGSAFGDGIAAGMSASHNKMSAVLKSIGDDILQAFGSYLIKQGEALLATAALEALAPGFFGGLSAGDIAAGTGLIALGTALKGVGGGLGGGGGGGGGGGSASSITPGGIASRQYMTPNASEGYAAGTQWPGHGGGFTHVTVIGPGDASAQNGMQKLMQNMVRRGMTVKGIGG